MVYSLGSKVYGPASAVFRLFHATAPRMPAQKRITTSGITLITNRWTYGR